MAKVLKCCASSAHRFMFEVAKVLRFCCNRRPLMSAQNSRGLETCSVSRSCLPQLAKVLILVFASSDQALMSAANGEARGFCFAASSSCRLEMAKFFKNDFHQALIESSPNGRDLETFCIELMTTLSCCFRAPPPPPLPPGFPEMLRR